MSLGGVWFVRSSSSCFGCCCFDSFKLFKLTFKLVFELHWFIEYPNNKDKYELDDEEVDVEDEGAAGSCLLVFEFICFKINNILETLF